LGEIAIRAFLLVRILGLAEPDEKSGGAAPIIADLQAFSATSLRQVVADLNARGIRTPRGGEWSAVQVDRVLDQLNRATA
jgi:hypothetical protein